MVLNYRYSRSTVKPETVEIGKTTVFLRKNIEKEICTDELGETITIWTYQEAKLTPDEFTAYASLLNSKDIVNSVNADSQLIIMEAIADLYDAVTNLTQGGAS